MPDASTLPPTQPKKQAVVLIHGIGEQQPMATLWQLVEIAWMKAPRPDGAPEPKVFSEPDEVQGVYELRRLSTNANAAGKRTDFFEYYWAHMMRDNEFGDVLAWLGNLAFRRRAQVPPQLHKAWFVLRTIALSLPFLAFVMFGGTIFSGASGQFWTLALIGSLIGLGVAALIVADQLFFSPVLGDAARYFQPMPKNVGCRQLIREKGVELLEKLHQSGKYDRIILVGHSLGGVIGYELVCHYWGRVNRRFDTPGPAQAAFARAERAAQTLEQARTPEGVAAAQKAWIEEQARLFQALAAHAPGLWLITDLVTLGSPLAHADTLMAEDLDAFARKRLRREVAVNPPALEYLQGEPRFTYCRRPGLADDPHAAPRTPHNAAAFATTRWTNIYFPMQGIMRGDLIGGPCRETFGPGVKDIAARSPRRGGWFPHLDYFQPTSQGAWGDPSWEDHRVALRTALEIETPLAAPAEANVEIR
jgi:predicted esterase